MHACPVSGPPLPRLTEPAVLFIHPVAHRSRNNSHSYSGEWEKAGEVPRELWLKAGEQGMLSMMVPEEYGGVGLDCRYPAIMWEEQVRHTESHAATHSD